jgi:hypothetical protein
MQIGNGRFVEANFSVIIIVFVMVVILVVACCELPTLSCGDDGIEVVSVDRRRKCENRPVRSNIYSVLPSQLGQSNILLRPVVRVSDKGGNVVGHS